MRWLHLLRLLPGAIGSVFVIAIATPLLALLDDRRRINRGHDMTDEQNPEQNPEENLLADNKLASAALHSVWHAAAALDAAGVPRTGDPQTVPLRGPGANELDLSDRIRLLAMERDASVSAGRAAQAQLDERAAQLSEANKRESEAEGHLSELHINLRQVTSAESVAEAFEIIGVTKSELAEARQQRDAFMRQRDEAIAETADASARAARFATTTDPRETIVRAEIVVDVASGTVVKNRHGRAFMIRRTIGARGPRARAKPRTKKPATATKKPRAKAKAKARR